MEASANSMAVSRTYAADLVLSSFGPLTNCRMMCEPIGPPFRKLDRLAEDSVLLAPLGDLMRITVSETSGG
ncbi:MULTISPECIES: hypothetical protein [unclassified Bradyrhizobium]|uniref:hypothetical protein n=1 Tax=unclassified Bradyrhizobium TaxID=2631580 RepID=UPI001FFBF3A4|nr:MULTISPECIES: hypothetical protein [unclassified Bradyrhizobium]MCK1345838.1 hypothetical protein [Bradyrhizobium sp. CW11]MCK1703563.1 hypothetical protein [Bradyrhizobium sp. 146]